MNFFEKIIYFLQGRMETPQPYGIFHLCSVVIAIALSVFLCIRFKNADEKTVKRLLMIAWISMLAFEVYKQLVFSFDYYPDIAEVKWDYQWYSFPFQFCSTPLYMLPFAIFLKPGGFRDAFISYLSFFSFIGGLIVYIMPGDVFMSMIGINIQTMLHHGIQVVAGVYLMVRYRNKTSWLHYLRGSAVFGASVLIALALNIAAPLWTNEAFNMFYIGPNFPCHMPVLKDIYASVPHVIFIIIFIAAFMLAGGIVFAVLLAIKKYSKNAA